MVGQSLLSRSPIAVDSSLSIAALFPASTCYVTPENGGLLKLFGNFLAMAVVLSLLTGKTYYRPLISKNEDPLTFGLGWDVCLCWRFCSRHALCLPPALIRA